MQIYVSDSAYNMSVKGRGTTGVAIGDGVNTVVLAWMSSGMLGWLCERCNGEGQVPGDRFNNGRRPRCGRCQGTGIRVQYADVAAATVAVKRYLEQRTLTPAELAELRADQRQHWLAEYALLVEQVRAQAVQSQFLRRLLRSFDRGQLWSPRQIASARRMLSMIWNPPPSRFYGQIGEKIEFTGVLRYTALAASNPYPGARRYTATVAGDGDFEGCWFRMIGQSRALQMLRGFDGDRVRMSGTVKRHHRALEVNRTWISHPKLLEHTQEPTAEQQDWPGELRGTSRDGILTLRRVRDGHHAYNLLATLFSDLRYGPVTTAELIMEGAEPVTFTADDVIGDDRAGRYSGLLADDGEDGGADEGDEG